MPISADRLFTRYPLDGIIREAKDRALAEVDAAQEEDILSLDEVKFAEEVIGRVTSEVPVLKLDEMYVEEEREANIDVSGRFDFDADGPGPHLVPGQRIVIAVPFEGDGNVFHFKRSYASSSIRARIEGRAILLTFANVSLDATQVIAEARRMGVQIEERLKWIENDFGVLRADIRREVPAAITRRRNGIQHRKSVVASLGIPMKRSASPAPVFSVPLARRERPIPKVVPRQLPRAEPEPEIETAEYEHILGVVQRLGISIERNPTAFSRMEEEEIRDIILVDLNGHYEGGATGETFNSKGKTDILITENGKAAFVAECKIWGGQKLLSETIDQILGYLTWRNTKTAVVIFNRNKDFSGVIENAKTTASNHPQYVCEIGKRNETSFTYQFKLPQDSSRLLLLTLVMFDVPPKKA